MKKTGTRLGQASLVSGGLLFKSNLLIDSIPTGVISAVIIVLNDPRQGPPTSGIDLQKLG